MRHWPSPQWAARLNLFQACPKTLQWSHLPQEVQRQVVHLLARLLREHRDGLLGAVAAKEICDE